MYDEHEVLNENLRYWLFDANGKQKGFVHIWVTPNGSFVGTLQTLYLDPCIHLTLSGSYDDVYSLKSRIELLIKHFGLSCTKKHDWHYQGTKQVE